MKLKLKDMSPKQLRKAADKYDITYTAETTNAELRKAIKAALAAPAPVVEEEKSAKPAKKKANSKARAKTPKAQATWPTDWPEEMHSAYYQAIVKEPMPKDKGEAFERLQMAIAAQTLEAEPIRTKFGYACFGLWYTPELKQCSLACQVMPLCKRICQSRPELKDRVAELEAAARELEAAQSLPAVEPVADKPTKRGRKKKAAEPQPEAEMTRYKWVGDVDSYETEDEDDAALIAWMASKKRKGFGLDELHKRLAKVYEESACPDVAQMLLKHLMGEGDVQAITPIKRSA